MTDVSSTPEQDPLAQSPFVALPIQHGRILRLLGPKPEESTATVDPLIEIDESLGVARSFVAGICDSDGRLIAPVEVILTVDPASIVPSKQIPTSSVLSQIEDLPGLLSRLMITPGYEILHRVLGNPVRLGPLLFCRKKRQVFPARSPHDAQLLNAIPSNALTDVKSADGMYHPSELVCWDGGDDQPSGDVNVYAGRGGSCSLGIIKSLDELVLDQGRVVALAMEMEQSDAVAADRLAGVHACVSCSERERCYPAGDDYVYASDRLTAISAACSPVVFRPLGDWRFDETCRIIGGMAPTKSVSSTDDRDNAFEQWRLAQSREFETAGPPRLLGDEADGRDLMEVARLKLALIADVLSQLHEVWRQTRRPHMCWNNETVRAMWRRPLTTPAMCWGVQPILRKQGMQPLSPFESRDGRSLPYPPAFSEDVYLPPKAVDAARYFDEPRRATLYLKRAQPDGDELIANVLLEELNIAWELFCLGDALHVSGDDWRAILSPMGQRDPDDGEGLPFSGRIIGSVQSFAKGDQIDAVECRWYPRFGEAVDLHAVGMLLFEALLSHDERTIHSFREQMASEIMELTTACLSLPPDQRDAHARNWVTERCEADAPAAIWTRRNLLHHRDARNATRLDAFPPALWQEIMTVGLRMTTCIPGFSYCQDRDCDVPRMSPEMLLPLIELNGLTALLDDQLFGRTAPGAAVREAVQPADS